MKRIYNSIKKMETEIPVSDIMIRNIIKLNGNETIYSAIKKMGEHSISGLIIIDDKENPIGIISEGDIIKKVLMKGKDLKKIKIKEIMTKNLTTISPKKSIGETSTLMQKKKISKLPVVYKKDIVGIVTKSDLMEKLNDIYKQNRGLKWLAAIVVIQIIVILLLIMKIVVP
ncbi:CBS domain-containing protein [archaeon]|nr:CBS domain-containing protein [archaeon]